MSDGPTTLVFAKAPAPGFAKTRLIPALGAEGAAQLARRLLSRTLSAALNAQLGPVELCTTPSTSHPYWGNVPLPAGITTSTQCHGDLGARMARACQPRLLDGPVLLVGTDCVEMSPLLLRQAAEALHHHDAVLYPTLDGGYALLGLKRYAPTLFANIPWSTAEVAQLTRARIAKLQWSLYLGARLRDIDQAQDLPWLAEMSFTE